MSRLYHNGSRSGWLVVAAAATVMLGVWSAYLGFGVFLLTLEANFGWSRGAISLAASFNLLLGGVFGFVLGFAVDRYGPHRILSGELLLTALSFVLLATTLTQLWQFQLYHGLLMGIAMSGLYFIPVATVSRWFVRQRGLALGILLAFNNLAFVLSAPLATLLIEALGWRGAYLALAGLVLLTLPLAATFVKYPPPGAAPILASSAAATASPQDQGLTAGEAIKDRRLWMLSLSWLFAGFVWMMLTIHMVPYAESLGNTLAQASVAMTLFGIGTVLGRFFIGVAADKLGTTRVFWISTALQVATLGGFLLEPSLAALYLLAAVFGVAVAGIDTAEVKATGEAFGTRALAAIMGLMNLGWRAGAALGPAAAGYVYDATGLYDIALASAIGATAITGVTFALGAGHRQRRPSAQEAFVHRSGKS